MLRPLATNYIDVIGMIVFLGVKIGNLVLLVDFRQKLEVISLKRYFSMSNRFKLCKTVGSKTTRTQLHGLARTYTHAHNRLHPSNYNANNWSNRGEINHINT